MTGEQCASARCSGLCDEGKESSKEKLSEFVVVENAIIGTTSLAFSKLNLLLDEVKDRIRCMVDIGSWPCHKEDYLLNEHWNNDEDSLKFVL